MTDAKIDKAVFNLLDDLMTKNRDAVEGYSKASSNISDMDMKETLISYAKRREAFAEEWKEEIKELGGEYTKGSSLASSVHRTWMDIASTFTGKENPFILKECLRGELVALKEYEDAAKNDFLPDSSQKIIRKHTEFLEGVIRNLKDKIAYYESVEA
ncbi:MAG TPA: PA2169 family four-helix-bundle protein [Saprospiraceae bacterium]|nr:PA2169 family four-helix-bundle protein [Saprospiraceae bacterium]